jgi:hypothetical protein
MKYYLTPYEVDNDSYFPKISWCRRDINSGTPFNRIYIDANGFYNNFWSYDFAFKTLEQAQEDADKHLLETLGFNSYFFIKDMEEFKAKLSALI